MSQVQFGTSAIAMPQSGPQRTEADGFINIYLPRANGKKFKLGYFALRGNNGDQKQLLDMLNKGEITAEDLLKWMIVEYNPNEKDRAGDLAIGTAATTAEEPATVSPF